MELAEYTAALRALPREEQERIIARCAQATARLRWIPNPGPQSDAYECEADELLFGGEAGGGKSDLGLGLALNEHRRSLVLRRVKEDALGLAARLVDIVGGDNDYTRSSQTYADGAHTIQFRGCETEAAKRRFKGDPHDYIYWDELSDFLETQYLYINQWLRTVEAGQRCRIVAGTNGPTTAEGQWIVRRWAPWLDPSYPNPAASGELRWFIRGKDDADVETPGPGYWQLDAGGGLVANGRGRGKPRKALSRTFIRSRLENNPDLAVTGYGDRLDQGTEELRRVYRQGDFTVGLRDGEFQVIPTRWIELAMQRWLDRPELERERPPRGARMTVQALDIAQGGPDFTVLSSRYGGWYAPLVCEPGDKTREGRDVLRLVVSHRRDKCPVVIDLGGGWGGDASIALAEQGIESVAFNGVKASAARTRDGKGGFFNLRAEAHWRFREELDPDQEGGSIVCLPPDPLLKADLAATKWEWVRGPGGMGVIKIEDKSEIKKRIGRSPDRGDSVVMCGGPGDKAVRASVARELAGRGDRRQANVGYADVKARLRGNG